MGIPAASSSTGAPPTGDQANAVVTGSFTAPGVSPLFGFYGPFNISIWGTFSGTLLLTRSFDGGTTWLTRTDAPGSGSYTTPTSISVSEPERGVLYQLDCSVLASGTANYRMSASGAAAMTSAGVPPR
jgi:hypothetical protein